MNEIEHATPFSKGTVNNIIQDWKARINGTDIEDIRAFIAEVRKSGMTLQECAQAFRAANILRKMGVYDEFDEQLAELGENENENEIRSQSQIENNNTAKKEEEEVNDIEQELEKKDSAGFKGRQTTNLLDLIRSASSFSQDGSTTHYTKTKRFENNKVPNAKGYQIAYFINTIYKKCKQYGIRPTILIDWIVDLFNFYSVLSEPSIKQSTIYHSSQNIDTNENTFPKEEMLLDDEINDEIPLVSKVSFFIEQRKKEIHQLVNERNSINEEINRLGEQKNKVQANLSNTIQGEKRAYSYFQWYNALKQELNEKFNIAIEEEYEAFARAINDFRDYGYNTLQIVTEYKDFASLREQRSLLKTEMDLNNQTRQHLFNDINQLKDQAYSYRQTLKTFYQLQQIGFGLPKLKELSGLITEISAVNNIDPSEAVTRFFKELEKNYDNKLGLESKLKEMRDEYELLKIKVDVNTRYLALENPVASDVAFLHSHGLTNDDIIGITNLVLSLNNSYLLDYKSIKKDDTTYTFLSNNKNNITDKKEFWKLIMERFGSLRIIDAQIENIRYQMKLKEMKELDKQGDSLV